MNYQKKLKHPKWQKKRLEILNRDDFTCQCCGDKETELQVHHKSYNGEPWEVDNEELTTLCNHCHLVTHMFKNEDFEVYKFHYKNSDLWSINVRRGKLIDGFLYRDSDNNGLMFNGCYNVDCLNELNKFINNG